MYIRKKDKKLFEDIDSNICLPHNWNKFISQIKENHNLIIKKIKLKSSYLYYCTNCHIQFEDIKKKINEKCECPNCKKSFLIKSNRLSKYVFEDNLGLLDKYKDYYILRHFELKSYYDGTMITTDVCEYGRQIFDDNFYQIHEIINSHICNYIGGVSVIHDGYVLDKNWKYFSSYYKSLGNCLIYYPYNIKQLFKYTRWQYSQLWTLAKKEQYFDIAYLLKNYCESIELLIKLKLYKLALCPKTFNRQGSFQDRFGIDKKFLSYMQNHNLDIDELEVLRYSKTKDIRLIRYFSKFDLNRIKKYDINLRNLKKLTNISYQNYNEYIDYLKMSKTLGYNMKDKKIIYPKDVIKEHDKVLKIYEMNKDKSINDAIKRKYKKLCKNTYQTKKYIIFPAKDINSMIDESKQQNNCVKTYCEDYANDICDIYFMRLNSNKNKSLVTIEVRDNKVVQQRTKNNQDTTKEQKLLLKKWENKILKVR